MSTLSVGAKRSTSAAQFASSDAGATRMLLDAVPDGRRSRVNSCCNTRSNDRTWIVLPIPMSSARQAPSPSGAAGTTSEHRPVGRALRSRGAPIRDRHGRDPPGCAGLAASPRAMGPPQPPTSRDPVPRQPPPRHPPKHRLPAASPLRREDRRPKRPPRRRGIDRAIAKVSCGPLRPIGPAGTASQLNL